MKFQARRSHQDLMMVEVVSLPMIVVVVVAVAVWWWWRHSVGWMGPFWFSWCPWLSKGERNSVA